MPPRREMGGSAWPLARWLEWAGRLEVSSIAVDVAWTRGPVAPARPTAPLNVVVRGLLGERLRDLRCLTRAPTCDGCREWPCCDYGTHFERPPGTDATDGESPVPSYWLQGVPATTAALDGTSCSVRLYVAGPATSALPYFDVALRDALVRVGAASASGPRPTLTASRVERRTLSSALGGSSGTVIRIIARTPLVLRGDWDACRAACPPAPWLAMLVRGGVRRLARLAGAFVPGAESPRAEFPRLDEVEVLVGGMEAWHGARYSQRQGRRIPIEGLAGSAVVRGEAVREIVPLLAALGVSSVGKQTTHGFGEIGVETLA